MDYKTTENVEKKSAIELFPGMTLPQKKDFLVEAMFCAGDLNDFADSLAKLIDHPVMMMTSSYSFLACSRIHSVTESVWNHAIKVGYYPDYIISYIVKNHREWDLAQHSQRLFERSLPFAENKRLVCNMCHQGEHLGAIVTLLTGKPLEEDDCELILFARDWIQKILALGGAKTTKMGTSQEILLIEILRGNIPNQDALHHRFLLETINDHEHFMLINVEFQTPEESGRIVSIIKNLFPQATVFEYDNRVLMFFAQHISIEISENTLRTLEDLLSSCNATACISDMYDNLLRTQEHYSKNVRVGKLSNISKDKRRIVFYSDYKFIDMYLLAIGSIGKFEMGSFICQKTYEIYKYDKENNTEYIDTLWNYLEAGESVSGAGKRMYVHRNTVAYRISRINDLFQIDLSNLKNAYMMYFSCCILRFHDRIQRSGDGDVAWKELNSIYIP